MEEDKCHPWLIFLTKWHCLLSVSESLMTLSVSWNKEVSRTGWKCYRRHGRNTKDRWQGDNLNTIHGIRASSAAAHLPTPALLLIHKRQRCCNSLSSLGRGLHTVCWLLGRFHRTGPRPLLFYLHQPLCYRLPTPNPAYSSLLTLLHFSLYF